MSAAIGAAIGAATASSSNVEATIPNLVFFIGAAVAFFIMIKLGQKGILNEGVVLFTFLPVMLIVGLLAAHITILLGG